jgi:hypothetical protein
VRANELKVEIFGLIKGFNSLFTHFLFRSLCNQLLKRTLNRFRFSGIWLQAHFEIIEDRLRRRRGDRRSFLPGREEGPLSCRTMFHRRISRRNWLI